MWSFDVGNDCRKHSSRQLHVIGLDLSCFLVTHRASRVCLGWKEYAQKGNHSNQENCFENTNSPGKKPARVQILQVNNPVPAESPQFLGPKSTKNDCLGRSPITIEDAAASNNTYEVDCQRKRKSVSACVLQNELTHHERNSFFSVLWWYQESPRQTKPKKGPKRKVHEFRPFLWILVFFLRKTSTIHIELLFRNAPAKSSWTDFFWFWFARATPDGNQTPHAEEHKYRTQMNSERVSNLQLQNH